MCVGVHVGGAKENDLIGCGGDSSAKGVHAGVMIG